MRLVVPGQEALEVLERAGTTKDECTSRLTAILSAKDVQLTIFRKRVQPETIILSDDPRRQGAFSFTYYISLDDDSEDKRFVAQFREKGVEETCLPVLDTAESIFGSYVAKPLFISIGNNLQVTIWDYYGDSIRQRWFYDNFMLEQKASAIRQYAEFLAQGCRNALPQSRMNSKVYEQFQRIASWSLPPSIARVILTLNTSLGFPLSQVWLTVDDLRQLPVVAMHRDHRLNNLLSNPDGVITKVIDWGMELSYEPLGVSLGRIEDYVEDSLELRQVFWNSFIPAIRHFLDEFPDIKRNMKTAKDVGFVVSSLLHCEDEDQVPSYELGRLERVLLNHDCINELN
jgi:Phosphotransferase enzyme family